ncbi:MAG: hypothetical protein KF773_39890 [Deltaproteobacteria bacterium]|nr:hypothetical protein [Deltaproteobacteria bacterium]MCW5803759.1 hypothetical protein [Deltaproteobacteria bacterium]
MHDVVESVKHGFSNAKTEVSRRASSVGNSLADVIKDHPFAAIAIGLAVGFMIAKLRR